jgi:putative nucleotidyltransferase with HDIG domain
MLPLDNSSGTNMKSDQLEIIERRFEEYLVEYDQMDSSAHPFIRVKIEHSRIVADEACAIARELGWDEEACNCAAAIGLLHDIGRFSQFKEYGTFSDASSVDHGERGWEVARHIGILSELAPEERAIVLDCIRFHNRRAIPTDISSATKPYLLLIRDADKLDILKIVLESVTRDGFEDLIEMLPNISSSMEPSPAIAEEIRRHRSASIANVASVGDFMLLQLSWVYGFNYAPTYRHLLARGLLQDLAKHIVGDETIRSIVDEMLDYGRGRAGKTEASYVNKPRENGKENR